MTFSLKFILLQDDRNPIRYLVRRCENIAIGRWSNLYYQCDEVHIAILLRRIVILVKQDMIGGKYLEDRFYSDEGVCPYNPIMCIYI